jgi:hypothetical protein
MISEMKALLNYSLASIRLLGHDETPTIDLKNLQLLFQGYDSTIRTRCSQLPYRLGLLRLNSVTTNPPPAAAPWK